MRVTRRAHTVPTDAAPSQAAGHAATPGPPLGRACSLAAWAAVVIGVMLRLYALRIDHSLTIDEARVATNVGSRSFIGLLSSLDDAQSAPLLFLYAEKLCVAAFGMHDTALRLVPFAASIAVLVLLWCVGREVVGERAALAATTLGALAPPLLAYAVVVKQYESDAAVTLLVAGLGLGVRRAPSSGRAWALLAAGGGLLLFASQPAVFVLAGVGLALAADGRVRAARGWATRACAVVALWLAVFALAYVAFYREVAALPYMRAYWERGMLSYAAIDPGTALSRIGFYTFAWPYWRPDPTLPLWALALVVVTMALSLVGFAVVARRRGLVPALFLGGPVAVALAASALGRYPMHGRLALWAVPLVLLAGGAALAGAAALLPRRVRGPAFAVALIGFVALRLGPARALIHATTVGEHVRPLVADYERRAGGAPLYVYARALPAWTYYTTDWAAPDRERLRWMGSAQALGGPAFENRGPRGHAVTGEGDTLVYAYRGRLEVLGLGSGRQIREANRPPVDAPPDAGWAQNEARRIHDAAARHVRRGGSVDRTSAGEAPAEVAWLLFSHEYPPERQLLLDAVRAAGARVEWMRVGDAVALYRVRFAAASPAHAVGSE